MFSERSAATGLLEAALKSDAFQEVRSLSRSEEWRDQAVPSNWLRNCSCELLINTAWSILAWVPLDQRTVDRNLRNYCVSTTTTYCLKAKAVPLHVTEALGWREGIAPTHSRLGIRWGWVAHVTPRPRFSPGKGPPVPIGQEAGLAPEPVWTQRLEEKSFRLCRGSNFDRPLVQSVARHYTDWATRLTRHTAAASKGAVGYTRLFLLSFSAVTAASCSYLLPISIRLCSCNERFQGCHQVPCYLIGLLELCGLVHRPV
jgi:hypothetical protein